MLKGKSFSKLVIKFYLRFPVHDCKVSEWGPWSPCSVRCGAGGFTERHRVVLHQASNGGLACPHLVQAKPCRGSSCDEDEPEENWTGKKKFTMLSFPGFFKIFLYFTEGLFHSSTESTTTGTTESNNGLDEKEDEKQIFHTLVHSSIHEKSPHNLHTRY